MKLAALTPLALVCALAAALPAIGGVRVSTRDEPLPAAAVRALAGAERILPARTAPARFNLVGLHWRGSGSVAFRTAPARGGWSPWRDARPEAEDAPDPGSGERRRTKAWKLGNPYWTGAATRIQYRVSGRVTRLRAHFLWSPVTSAPRRAPQLVPSQPAIITRAQWGADESIVRGSPSYADRLAFSVVHHTAGTMPTSPSQSAAVVRGVLTYHVKSNGWNDVGYNFLVDPFGQVFEGRAGGTTRNVIGAHAQGFNTGSVGVALLGTYESTQIAPAAQTALTNLLAWRLDLAHVDPLSRLVWTSAGNTKFPAGTTVTLNGVNGHRDTGSTSCPGARLYGTLGSIASEAAASGGPKLFDPRVSGSLGGPVRFTARISTSRAWAITVRDALGAQVASGTGAGTAVDWTWQSAGAAPGRYTYTIDAGPETRAVVAPVGPAVPLVLGPLSVKPSVFTPNGDGVADTTTVSVSASTAATLDARVEDAKGERVATLAAGRAVPAGTTRLTWHGRTAGGTDAPDGRYTVVVEAATGAERAARSVAVVVDRTLGRLTTAPSPFSPNGDGRRESLAIGFGLAGEASTSVRVFRGTAAVTTLHTGRLGEGTHAFAWDGRANGRRVPDSRLRIVVEATTALGRRVLSKDVVLDSAAPRVASLTARRERKGTTVRFRLSEPARLVVRFGAVTVRTQRGTGTVTLWRRVRPARVSVRAEDAAQNVAAPVSARVR